MRRRALVSSHVTVSSFANRRASSGLGFVIWQARRFFKTPEVMAGVIAIGIIGLATDQLVRALHRRWFGYLA